MPKRKRYYDKDKTTEFYLPPMLKASLRRISIMASSTTSSPFTKAVVSAIRNVYPEHLADHSFDNTGLLLEAPFDKQRQPLKNTVLLTNDLTTAVADEAINRKDSVVVAYRQCYRPST